MNIRFIPEGPALLVRNRERILVIADLHIGIEAELRARAWHVGSRTKERLERLMSCIELARPDLLLILGDIKHNLPRTTRQEYHELPEFLERIRSSVPVRIVPGNHDTSISRFIREEETLAKTGALVDGTGYLHGHTALSPDLLGHLIISGHHHPLVSVNDEVGCALRSPAYLLAALDPGLLGPAVKTKQVLKEPLVPDHGSTRVLFMPAFNECAGFDVLQIIRRPFSPISRAILPGSAEVFLPDGTYLGPAAALEGAESAAESS